MEGREESWGRDTATPSTPYHQHVRESSKGQVSRKKYPALTASQLVPDILLGKVPPTFLATLHLLFLNWRNVSLPCLLYIPLLCTHAHTKIQTPRDKLLICIWDMDCRGILLKNLEGPVFPVWLSLESTNSSLLLLLCSPVEKISKPYLQILLPLGPLPNGVLLRQSLFH